MLRLNVQESLPWTDSKGRIRSSLEEFRFLDESLRQVIQSGQGTDVTVWELGVLSDTTDTPELLKPQWSVSTATAGTPGFAVGYASALQFKTDLAGMWQQVINWLAGDRFVRVFVSDEFDVLTGERIDHASTSWTDFVLNQGLRLTRVGRGGMYTGRLEQAGLSTLLQHWWPSGLGAFAGMTLTDPAIDARIEATRSLRLEDFSGVMHCFQTSRSYDNLGIVVLTRGMTWTDLKAELEIHGWYTGRLLNAGLDKPGALT